MDFISLYLPSAVVLSLFLEVLLMLYWGLNPKSTHDANGTCCSEDAKRTPAASVIPPRAPASNISQPCVCCYANQMPTHTLARTHTEKMVANEVTSWNVSGKGS